MENDAGSGPATARGGSPSMDAHVATIARPEDPVDAKRRRLDAPASAPTPSSTPIAEDEDDATRRRSSEGAGPSADARPATARDARAVDANDDAEMIARRPPSGRTDDDASALPPTPRWPSNPSELRDALSRRRVLDPPRGFKPAEVPRALLAGLPVSFLLTLLPHGFALGKPRPDVATPPPPFRDALATIGERAIVHPYDRSSRALLQAIDAGRLPRALLDGLPLRYVDGAALAEVHDYRACGVPGEVALGAAVATTRGGRATCKWRVAVLHSTSATVAADAEEICGQLDVAAPADGAGYRRVDDDGGDGGGGGGGGATREKSALGMMMKKKKLTDADAAAAHAAQLARRFAVEGALLKATSAPLCLDPSPRVAAERRRAHAAAYHAAAPFGGVPATLLWSTRTRTPPRAPSAEEPLSLCGEKPNVQRWLAAAPALESPPPPPSAAALESAARAEDGEDAATWASDTGALWASTGDAEEKPYADPLNGRTVWGDAIDATATATAAAATAATTAIKPESTTATVKTETETTAVPSIARDDDDEYDETDIGADERNAGVLRLRTATRMEAWKTLAGDGARAADAAAKREEKKVFAKEREDAGRRAVASVTAAGVNGVVSPDAIAEATLKKTESEQPITMKQRYEAEWLRFLPADQASRVRPLRYAGVAYPDGPPSPRGHDGDDDGDDAPRGIRADSEVKFQIDVGPGAVDAAADDDGRDDGTIVELPPFRGEDAGKFMLEFHKLAAREGLAHYHHGVETDGGRAKFVGITQQHRRNSEAAAAARAQQRSSPLSGPPPPEAITDTHPEPPRFDSPGIH